MADLVYLQDNIWEALDEENDIEAASASIQMHALPTPPQQMDSEEFQLRKKFMDWRRLGDESDPDIPSDEEEEFQLRKTHPWNLLKPVEKLAKYVESEEMVIRLAVGKLMLTTLRSVADSPGDVARVMELFCVTATDEKDVVRSKMIKQIPDIARLCNEDTERLHFVIQDHLLPLVVKFLSDRENQVRIVAQSVLWSLMEGGLIDETAIEREVCPFILQQTEHDSETENTGIFALMNKVASYMSKEATERILMPRFAELCSDKELYVRRRCAENFGSFCAVVSQEATENFLLPHFIQLCMDNIWGIRKICAEAFLSLACCVSPSKRKQILTPVLVQLMSDTSQWVKISAFQTLGPFIATFADPNLMPLDESGYLLLLTTSGYEFKIHRSFMETDFENTECEIQETTENKESETDILESDLDGDDISSLIFESESTKLTRRKGRTTLNELGRSPWELFCSKMKPYKINSDCQNTSSDNWQENPQEPPSTLIKVERQSEGGLNVHVDTGPPLDHFNTFQFWRTPIPDLELDFSLAGGEPSASQPTAVHVKATVTDPVSQMTCISELNVSVDLSSEDIKDENQFPQITASRHIVVEDLCGSDSRKGYRSQMLQQEALFSEALGHNSTFTKEDSPVVIPPIAPPRLEEAHKQKIVPPILIEYFVWMADQHHMSEDDMPLYCAYSLPAVALTLTKNHWDCLSSAYTKLATNIQWKVRHIMASCIYKVAEILGQRITCDCLIPIFKNMIQDVDVVRISCLKHLYDFLKLLSMRARIPFLPLLEDFLQMDNELNWRLREEFALQLYLSVPLFPGQLARRYLTPLTMRLLFDQVSAVRQMAILLATQLIHQISNDASLLRDLLAIFAEELAHSIRWTRRQTFVLLCSKILSEQTLNDENFGRELLPHLADLCWDKVANVRLTLARTITNDLMPNEYFSGENSPHSKQLISALKKLSKDTDRDVRQFASYNLESYTTNNSTSEITNLFNNGNFIHMNDNSDLGELDS